jgi:hypothetical protein
MRKAAYRLAESDSSPLRDGGRKSRKAGLQPRAPKSVYAWPTTAAKRRCQAHSRWQMADGRWQMADGRRQTALRALKGQVRKATCRLSESDSSPLSIGGRQSREAGLQPRGAKSVNASLATAAKNRCQAHSRWRTALLAPKWQARMCRKQPNVGQKATLPRSASMEGRVVRFTGQTRHGNRRRRSSSPLPQGGGRSPGPLRQQSHSEGRRVRRPQRCRATSTSRPP